MSTLTDDQFFVILSIGHNEALCSVAVLCDLDKLSLLFQFTKVLHYLKKKPKKQTKNQNFMTTSKDYFQPLLTTFLPYHKFHCIFSENKALGDDTCLDVTNDEMKKFFFCFFSIYLIVCILTRLEAILLANRDFFLTRRRSKNTPLPSIILTISADAFNAKESKQPTTCITT